MLKLCSIESCKNIHKAKTYCRYHYKNWWKYGDPLGNKWKYGDCLNLLNDILNSNTDECILWTRGTDIGGYGKIAYEKKYRRVSQVVCEITYGPRPVPDKFKYEAAHSCGVRLCCNPKHLRWATSSENQMDRVLHGTSNRGERNSQCKLTIDKVLDIRSRCSTQSVKSLAVEFDVSPRNIRNIINRDSWKWL